jgi:uncharacterized SAM-binding protein YcdF (DUF218 family)
VLRDAVLPVDDLAAVERAEDDFVPLALRAVAVRPVVLRPEPDAAFEPEARVVRFAVLFVASDFVAPRALLFAAVRLVPVLLAPELFAAELFVPELRAEVLREPEDFAAVPRALVPDFAEVRREPEAVLLRAVVLFVSPDALLRAVVDLRAVLALRVEALPSPDALLRAVVDLRAVLVFRVEALPSPALLRAVVDLRAVLVLRPELPSPEALLRALVDLRAVLVLRPEVLPSPDALLRAVVDLRPLVDLPVVDLRAEVFFSVVSLFDAAVRLFEPAALRRAVPLRALVPSLFVVRRFAVEPLLALEALRPPPRERTNLKNRLVSPEATSS